MQNYRRQFYEYSLRGDELLNATYEEAGHQPISDVDWTGMVNEEELFEHLFSLKPGGHEEAIDWLNRYGAWGGFHYSPPLIRNFEERGRSIQAAHWWAEALLLRRTLWLHQFLLDVNQTGPEYSQACYSICLREEPSFSPFSGERPGLFHGVKWPEEHSLAIEGFELSIDSVLIARMKNTTSEFFLWETLAHLLHDGISRNAYQPEIYFDKQRGCVRETEPDELPALAELCWRLLRSRILNEKPPIRCKVCRAPVRVKRKTRQICHRQRCKDVSSGRVKPRKGELLYQNNESRKPVTLEPEINKLTIEPLDTILPFNNHAQEVSD